MLRERIECLRTMRRQSPGAPKRQWRQGRRATSVEQTFTPHTNHELARALLSFRRTRNIYFADWREETKMLWTIIVILLILWLLGFIGHVGGGLIHLLLVIAVIVLVINLITGRRAV